VRRVGLAWFAVLLEVIALAAAHAQANAESNSVPIAYLLRMERCAQLRTRVSCFAAIVDITWSNYLANRIDIFEASIPATELQELQHILDSDELFQLKQEKNKCAKSFITT
jgi:hypothetical protein